MAHKMCIGFVVLCLLNGCGGNSLPDGVVLIESPDVSQLDDAAKQQVNSAFKSIQKLQTDPPADQPAKKTAALYAQAGQVFQSYDVIDLAIACYENSLSYQKDGDILHLLGRAYRETDQMEIAADAFSHAADFLINDRAAMPYVVASLYWAGDSYLELDEIETAREKFQLGIDRTNGRQPIFYLGLGKTYMEEDPVKAIEHLSRAEGMIPGRKNILYLLMTAHRKIGEVERAKQYQEQFEKSVERLLSVDPLHVKVQGLRKTVSAHRMRGNTALFKEKNYVEAVRHFKLALEEKPNDAILNVNYGVAMMYLGNIEIAGESFAKAITLDRTRITAYINLASVHQRQGKLDEAISVLLQALGQNPSTLDAHSLLAEIYLTKQEFAKAIELYDHILQKQPANEFALQGRSIALAKSRRYREAMEQLEGRLQVLEQHPNLIFLLVQVLASAPDDAVRDLERAQEVLDLVADSEEYADYVAECQAMIHADRGEFETAIQFQTKAMKISESLGREGRREIQQTALDLYKNDKPQRMEATE